MDEKRKVRGLDRLAKASGIPKSTLQHWAALNKIVRGPGGYFDVAAVQAYATAFPHRNTGRRQVSDEAKSLDERLDKAKVEKLEHQRNLLAIEEAKRRGELLERAAVAEAWRQHSQRWADGVRDLMDRLCGLCAGLSVEAAREVNHREAKAIIEQINDAADGSLIWKSEVAK